MDKVKVAINESKQDFCIDNNIALLSAMDPPSTDRQGREIYRRTINVLFTRLCRVLQCILIYHGPQSADQSLSIESLSIPIGFVISTCFEIGRSWNPVNRFPSSIPFVRGLETMSFLTILSDRTRDQSCKGVKISSTNAPESLWV